MPSESCTWDCTCKIGLISLSLSFLLASNPLYLLVAVKQRIMFAHEGGKLSYADRCLEQALTCIKRLLQKLVVRHHPSPGPI